MGLQINHDKSGLSQEKLESFEQSLTQELSIVQAASKGMYETPYASINLSLDSNHLRQAKSLARK
jgi:hypothetical protein